MFWRHLKRNLYTIAQYAFWLPVPTCIHYLVVQFDLRHIVFNHKQCLDRCSTVQADIANLQASIVQYTGYVSRP